ncbi:MAG: DUF3990 domain-containing protein [Oscillospiraceae bacterium]|nr:DUF3990 domain-containing protein [Oscillospiraceae bacterium]
MTKLTLYHGTDSDFETIDLSKSLEKRDFGTGFYTTTISSQAERWALNKKVRNTSEHAYVYVYEAGIPDALSLKSFDGLSLEWLEMIRTNRQLGGIQHGYDIVIGPVANDDTMLTVNRFIQGIYTAEEALERLRFSKANDQVSFHTEAAVSCLKLVRRYQVD